MLVANRAASLLIFVLDMGSPLLDRSFISWCPLCQGFDSAEVCNVCGESRTIHSALHRNVSYVKHVLGSTHLRGRATRVRRACAGRLLAPR